MQNSNESEGDKGPELRVPLSPREAMARREAVNFARNNSRLEGIESQPDLVALKDRYASGEITEREFQHACFDMVKAMTPNKDWAPKLDEPD
jgi:hypothetical protein